MFAQPRLGRIEYSDSHLPFLRVKPGDLYNDSNRSTRLRPSWWGKTYNDRK